LREVFFWDDTSKFLSHSALGHNENFWGHESSGAAALGFDFEGIVGVVMALTPSNFYKSMTR
jgi:hypothetical protein